DGVAARLHARRRRVVLPRPPVVVPRTPVNLVAGRRRAPREPLGKRLSRHSANLTRHSGRRWFTRVGYALLSTGRSAGSPAAGGDAAPAAGTVAARRARAGTGVNVDRTEVAPLVEHPAQTSRARRAARYADATG